MGPSGERGEGWFTSLYATHYPHIVRYGLRRTADLDSSVELAQEVFVVAWQRRADIPQRRELPWLYGVARRILANWWRSQRRRPTATALVDPAQHAAVAEHPMSPEHPESAVWLVDLLTALLSLSEKDQEILRLIAWEGLSTAEAAVVLGCGQAAARIRLHRARRRLRAAMSEHPRSGHSPDPGTDHAQHRRIDHAQDPTRILEKHSDERPSAATGTSRPR